MHKMFFAQNVMNSVNIAYGFLYNWYVASSANIAPDGWHVPTHQEWNTLGVTLGGRDDGLYVSYCSQHLKTVPYSIDNTEPWVQGNATYPTNSSGMTVNPSGVRWSDGHFSGRGSDSNFWCSDEQDSFLGRYKNINYNTDTLYTSSMNYDKRFGFGIRLLKNDSNDTGSVVDIDGNVYPTVKIGNQVWMAQNLRVSRYNNGTAIPDVAMSSMWSTLDYGALCQYSEA